MKIKKILKAAIALAIVATMASCFSGCSNSDANSIVSDTNSNLAKIKNMEIAINGNIDMSLSISGTTIPYKSTVDAKIQASSDPLLSHTTGTVNTEIFGNSATSNIESYLVAEDSKNMTTYTKSSDGSDTWTKSTSSYDKDSSILDIVSPLSDTSKCTYEIKETDKKINDKDVYFLHTSLSGDTLKQFLSSSAFSMESSTSEFTNTEDLSSINAPVNFYIYKDTKLPACIEIDLGSAMEDLSKKGNSSEASPDTAGSNSITASKLFFSLTFDNFDKVKDISVPQTVKDSAITINSNSTDAALEEAPAATNFESDKDVVG